jgi:type IV secretion system protein VirB4
MSVDVAALVFTPGTVGPVLFGIGAVAAAAIAAALAMPPISRKLMPLPKETRLVDFMPFTTFLKDGATIQTKRGDLVRVYRIGGAELAVASEGEMEMMFKARRTWLSQVAEKGANVRVFTVRSAMKPGELMEHPIPHMRKLARTWEDSFHKNSFNTEHYVVLSVSQASGEGGMDEASQLTMAGLSVFKPVMLSVHSGESPLKILARLAAPITRPDPKPRPGADVSDQITSDTVHFSDDKTGLITFHSGTRKRFMAVVGIKTWGDVTEERMLFELASLKFDYTIYHYVEPYGRAKGTIQLDMQRRLARTTFMSETAQIQFAEVAEIIAGGDDESQAICNYGLNLMVEADTEAELDRRIGQINTIAAQYQVTTIREGAVSQAIWWSQFPTYDKLPRPWKPLAANVSTLLALQRNTPGAKFSPWGKSPVTVLRTSTGGPYNFVFHDMSDPSNKEPLGHMLVVGPSGSGKTLTTSMLSMMAMRYPELRVFFFDRFNGTEVVTNMCGGKYIKFDGGDASMNPLQMDLTPRNVEYLKTFFPLITDLNDPDSMAEFGQAIDMLDLIPQDRRNLKDIQNTAFAVDGKARNAIRPWTNDNQFGQLFCATQDSMDLSNRMIGFDFTNVLDPDSKTNVGPAVVSYIMHRTMDVSVHQGHPALYFVDETAPLLKNKFFAAKFAAGLQEGRKLGQVFICAFQRPNAITESEHGQTILGQCATQIFFRNPKQKREDFALFGMTKRELDFVMGASHMHLPRAFLLRRISETEGIESVVIDADMSVMGNGLATFASGIGSVRKIRELMAQDPENFRGLYMDWIESERAAA